MLFGRSLFGGALYPRQVTAEGSVSATGRCIADEVASYKAGGGTFSTASVARGGGIRNVLPVLVTGAGAASVQVAEVAHFSLGGEAGISAGVKGTAKAEFSLAGLSTGEGSASGWNLRTLRVRRTSHTTGVALPEAEAYVYVYVHGEVARAYAHPFGTHFYVGRGESPAVASAEAQALQVRMAGGHCAAFGQVSATAQAASNGVALPAEAQALLDSDPELEIEGVTHVFGRGEAVGKALPHAEEYVYTVMLAVGRATVAGDAQALRASGGRVQAASSATGSMERVLPFEGSVTVGADAQGGARARLAAFGASRIVSVAATGEASARYDAAAEVRTDSSATAQILRLALAVRPGAAGGSAAAEDRGGRRVATGDVRSQAVSQAAGRVRVWFSLYGEAEGLGRPQADAVFHPKIDLSGDTHATATVVSLAERLADRAAGEVLAEAYLEGFNVVAGGDQALIRRVVRVGPAARNLTIPAPQNVVLVGGASRRLAA